MLTSPSRRPVANRPVMLSPPRLFPDDIDVAVVSHNGRSTLPRVLDDLARTGAPPDRIVVYDVASTDATTTWLAEAWPGVRRVRLETNAGPNPARNRAIAEAQRPRLLLVDSDAYLQPDVPYRLREALEDHADAGAAVPVVVHADRPGTIQYAGGRLHFICEAINPWADRPLAARGVAPNAIGTAPGVCFLLDVASARAVGGFDPAYFMGKEDGEFCYRLRVAGFRLIEAPRAIAHHGSRPRSAWLFSFQIRNRWHFILKNYDTRTLLLLAPALVLHEGVQFAMLAARGQVRAWWTAVREIGPMCRTLRADRRRVAASRRTADGEILDAAPLLVRADLVGGRLGTLAKSAYDRWLDAYWRLVGRWLR